jgi:hypothetical protein
MRKWVSDRVPISINDAIAGVYDFPPPYTYKRRGKSCAAFCREKLMQFVRNGYFVLDGQTIMAAEPISVQRIGRGKLIDTLKLEQHIEPRSLGLSVGRLEKLRQLMQRMGWLTADSNNTQWQWCGPDDATTAGLWAFEKLTRGKQ